MRKLDRMEINAKQLLMVLRKRIVLRKHTAARYYFDRAPRCLLFGVCHFWLRIRTEEPTILSSLVRARCK